MKKWFASFMAAAVVFLGLGIGVYDSLAQEKTANKTTVKKTAAIAAKPAAKTAAKTSAPKALQGKLTIAGSTSVQPFSEVLAESFMAKNKNVHISVQGGGSSQGVQAALSEVADIGASSRDLTEKEKAIGLKEIEIARDGIAVVVNPTNPVKNLTSEQLKEVFSGRYTNWKDVGGRDQKITVVIREAGSGTRDGFESMAMKGKKTEKKALVANSTGAVKTTVAGDPGAVGYMSMASTDNTVKALSIDDVTPSPVTVKNKTYLLNRPFIYIIKFEASGLQKAFIDYVLSPEGQKILAEEGAVPVN